MQGKYCAEVYQEHRGHATKSKWVIYKGLLTECNYYLLNTFCIPGWRELKYAAIVTNSRSLYVKHTSQVHFTSAKDHFHYRAKRNVQYTS